MLDDLFFRQDPFVFVAILLIVLAFALEAPYRIGRRFVRNESIKDEVWTTIYAGLLGLVAFMLGLSFAQAQGRYDARRALVVEEANTIDVVWHRTDLLPGPDAAQFRIILQHYAATRLQAYELPRDRSVMNRAIVLSDADQQTMWRIASQALIQHPGSLGYSLLLQSVNDLIDRSEEQIAALTQHIPSSVVLLTVLLVFLATLATGFSFARVKARPGIFGVIYIIALTLVMQVVVDLDRPQSGFIRVSLEPLRAEIASMHRGR